MSKYWCFTLNNYTEEDLTKILTIEHSYLIFGKEIGEGRIEYRCSTCGTQFADLEKPTCNCWVVLDEFEYTDIEKFGTPHLQGYIEFSGRKKFDTVVRHFEKFLGHRKTHIEMRKGTAKQAAEYCKKDGEFVELGKISEVNPGHRSDLDEVRSDAANEGMRKVTEKHSYQAIKVAEKYMEYNEEPRDWEPYSIWIFGNTGVGKSTFAKSIYGMDDTYVKNTATKWYVGYDAHDVVIFDDFRENWMPDITDFLSMFDDIPRQVETKGGIRQFKPHKIITTSILPPWNCYHGTGEDIEQLVRRQNEIIELKIENGIWKKYWHKKTANHQGGRLVPPIPEGNLVPEVSHIKKEEKHPETPLTQKVSEVPEVGGVILSPPTKTPSDDEFIKFVEEADKNSEEPKITVNENLEKAIEIATFAMRRDANNIGNIVRHPTNIEKKTTEIIRRGPPSRKKRGY